MDPIPSADIAQPADPERPIDTSPFLRQEGRRPVPASGVPRGGAADEQGLRRIRATLLPDAGGAERVPGHALWLAWLVQRLRPTR